MRTPNLIDVPKDSPSRRDKVKAFKAKHRIWTHDSGKNFTDEDGERWIAIPLNLAYDSVGCYCEEHDKNSSDNDLALDLISYTCRLLDESGLAGYGKSEPEAIRALCSQRDIPCDL